MYDALHLYIDGHFIGAEGREGRPVHNPATDEKIGWLPHASADDLAHALAAAERAFPLWKAQSPLARGKILRRVAELTRERAETIGRNITLDEGKPLAEAKSELERSADHLDWHAEECRRIYGRVVPPRSPDVRQLVLREPVGVCVAFTPWNFPYSQAIRKIAAALGAGCTLVIKGPEDAPSAVVAIARMFHEAGLPPGVLNVVWGDPPEVSRTLLASDIVRKVSFTGSVPVGKHIAALAAAGMKRTTMELGGHSAAIVCDDADAEGAAKALAAFKFLNAGQLCIAPNRFFIHAKVFDKFMASFLSAAQALRVGPGLDAATTMGPLAHPRRLEAMASFVEDAVGHGARVEAGGERVGSRGNFFSPTVLTNVPPQARMMHSETFGPIAPCVAFSDLDEAIRQANQVPYALSSYAFTGSTRNALAIQNGIEAGNVNINHFGLALPELPFGGYKDSGIGSEGGTETFDGYLVTKLVTQLQ